jgi:hypothetical protein
VYGDMGDVLMVQGLPVCYTAQGVLRALHRLGAHLRVPRMLLRYSPSEEETAHEEAVAQAALVRVASLCYDSTRSPDLTSSHAEDVPMSAPQSRLTTANLADAIDAWYAATTDGATTVITLPDAPAIYLTHQPHAQVRWRTAGRKGLTMPLTEARERLAMVLGR